MKHKLFIASDHAGFVLKSKIKALFPEVTWTDLGPHTEERCDYPVLARKTCEAILKDFNGDDLLEPRGVLICGSGVGMSMAANRFKGIRAVLGTRKDMVEMSRRHNASNVLCFGQRFLSEGEVRDMMQIWLSAKFEGDRHLTRVFQMDE